MLAQQGGKPEFIEGHILVGGFPEGTDFLSFATGCKGLLPDSQGQELLEVLYFGITTADFPLRHRPARDMQLLSQVDLGQAELCAQCHHHLTKGSVAFPIRGPFHRRSPFRLTHWRETP